MAPGTQAAVGNQGGHQGPGEMGTGHLGFSGGSSITRANALGRNLDLLGGVKHPEAEGYLQGVKGSPRQLCKQCSENKMLGLGDPARSNALFPLCLICLTETTQTSSQQFIIHSFT